MDANVNDSVIVADLKKQYIKKFNTIPRGRYCNDVDWLSNRLNDGNNNNLDTITTTTTTTTTAKKRADANVNDSVVVADLNNDGEDISIRRIESLRVDLDRKKMLEEDIASRENEDHSIFVDMYECERCGYTDSNRSKVLTHELSCKVVTSQACNSNKIDLQRRKDEIKNYDIVQLRTAYNDEFGNIPKSASYSNDKDWLRKRLLGSINFDVFALKRNKNTSNYTIEVPAGCTSFGLKVVDGHIDETKTPYTMIDRATDGGFAASLNRIEPRDVLVSINTEKLGTIALTGMNLVESYMFVTCQERPLKLTLRRGVFS